MCRSSGIKALRKYGSMSQQYGYPPNFTFFVKFTDKADDVVVRSGIVFIAFNICFQVYEEFEPDDVAESEKPVKRQRMVYDRQGIIFTESGILRFSLQER